MRSTLDYYDAEGEAIADAYESVDFRPVVTKLLEYAPAGGSLLDLGCGSGRDAAFFLEQGYDVTALDGSATMLSEAAHRHPELRGRTQHHQLPAALPFFSDSFDLVISVAVIMHLPEREIPGVFGEIARVLVPGGTVAYSVNRTRPGLDAGGNDPKGRHFTCLSSDAWEELHRRAGFRTVTGWESEDITGRPGISWVTFICKKE